jgi:hypothetical protein
MGTGARALRIGMLDAAYRSIRSGHGQPVDVDEEVAAG